MLGLVNTPNGTAPVGIQELPEPIPAPNEALVAVRTFSLNRGELTLLRIRPAGWRPGQDIAGTVLEAAADGSGPKPGVRVLALLDWHGWAERGGSGLPPGGVARQREFRARRRATGGRHHGAAHLAPRRAALGKARAHHRGRGRGR